MGWRREVYASICEQQEADRRRAIALKAKAARKEAKAAAEAKVQLELQKHVARLQRPTRRSGMWMEKTARKLPGTRASMVASVVSA